MPTTYPIGAYKFSYNSIGKNGIYTEHHSLKYKKLQLNYLTMVITRKLVSLSR